MEMRRIWIFSLIFYAGCSDIKVIQGESQKTSIEEGSTTTSPDGASGRVPSGSNGVSPPANIDLHQGPISGDFQGTVLLPNEGAESVGEVEADIADSSGQTNCPTVPAGYRGLGYTAIEVLSAAGAVLASTTTTECGEFGLDIPADGTQLRYTNEECQTLLQDISGGSSATVDTNIISMIEETSGLILDDIQKMDDSQIAFTIKDLITDKSLLGIQLGDIEIRIDGQLTTLLEFSYADEISPASVGLSLDLSGSMSSLLSGTNEEKYGVVGLAAHRFIDLKSEDDEVAFNVFSSSVSHIDNSFVSSLNLNGASVPYSASGFVTDPLSSRFAIDFYNPDSAIHGGPESLHQSLADQFGNLNVSGFSSPWHGGTALWDGVGSLLQKTALQSNDRKFVVILTDGYENSSINFNNHQQVIDLANNLKIPVYTLGFGSDSQIDKSTLIDVAEQTGGTFRQIQSVSDVTTAFEGLQSGFRYQYVVKSSVSFSAGATVEITVKSAESTVQKTWTVGL